MKNARLLQYAVSSAIRTEVRRGFGDGILRESRVNRPELRKIIGFVMAIAKEPPIQQGQANM